MSKTKIKTKVSVLTKDDKDAILNKYRSKGKLKKPTKPSLGKKPKASASLFKIEEYLKKSNAKMERYNEELKAYEQVKREKQNARQTLNNELLKLRF